MMVGMIARCGVTLFATVHDIKPVSYTHLDVYKRQAVTAAIDKAEQAVGEDAMYLDSSVIPSPDKRLWDSIL